MYRVDCRMVDLYVSLMSGRILILAVICLFDSLAK